QFGDAEVEQFGEASGGDENVRGFDVAVDHQTAVCIGDGSAHFAKRLDAFADARAARVAKLVDALAVDPLHHQVEEALRGFAPVDEAGNAGVVRVCEDLALAAEAGARVGAGEAAGQHLDGDILFDLAIDPTSAVDDRHATAPNLTDDLEGTEAPA